MQHEDKLISFLKSIGISIGEDLHEKLCSQDSQPRVMYDLSKIHKPLINGFPKLRPILSALNTGTSKWAKNFVSLLWYLIFNESLKGSFEFANIIWICSQGAFLYQASLDVDSLLTNLPLDETSNVYVNERFKNNKSVHGLNKKRISDILSLLTKE